ncbi:MAG TPA: tetratricopeptide repeat protein [Candidatus Paceibacterota bacterium]|nr:tetratricopeptide repeat protein [Candidatus Paceibacterota bacterium]
MHSRLMEWSRYVYLAALAFALAFIIPTAWFPFQPAKLAIFAVLLFAALFMYGLGGGTRDLLRAHGLKFVFLTGLLPFAYLLSYFSSVGRAVGFMGSGIEVDTVLFALLGFLAFFAGFIFFRTLRTAKLLLSTVLAVLLAAAVFQWIVIFFGASVVPFSVFADRSVNVIGKWNDLGLVAGLALMILLARAELALPRAWARRGLIAAGILALVLLLAVINFSLVWAFLLAGSIALALVRFLSQKGEEPMYAELGANASRGAAMLDRIPWWSLGGAVVSIVFLFAGPMVNTALTSVFPVTSLEVRPSYESTLGVVDAAREGSFKRLLVGTGPNTFGTSWLAHKPAEVNQSAFWSLDFNVGFSTLLTALGTVGFAGVAAWLVPLILVLASLVRAIRLRVLSREERITAVTISLASILFFASLIFYIPSQNLIVLGLALSGAAFGFLWRQGRAGAQEEGAEESSRLKRLALVFAMPLVLLVSLGSAFFTVRHLAAEAIVGRGSVALQAGDFDGALARANRAAKLEKSNTDPLRLAVTADINKLQQLASTDANAANAADVQAQFATLAQQAIAAGQALVEKDPGDYRSHLLMGQLYEFFASLKVEGAYDKSKEAYLSAIKYNPQNPQIPLLVARLEVGQNHTADVQTYLEQSLKLKPNYTDAILFLVQLNVANNDLPNAIRAATAAAQSAPGVASIWFELGLLYYSANDTKDAIAPLEQAVALVPEYANAKYFLGLSYYAQQRAADAVKQFEDLARSNPDSAEVRLILGNLRAGKPPFDSATPPATTPPEDRTTAPINE